VKPSLPQMLGVAAAGTVVLTVMAWAVFVWVDEPVRAWLKRRWTTKMVVSYLQKR
jgi:peptidoglycan/LPS O-acetylase OafA/YrhL